ncbi:carboxypeptidase-like regulatory domain-containing protein [Actinomadura fibrosa]
MANGEITVPLGEDPEGVGIVNRTALQATVSDQAGLFQIPVKVGDTLEFSSLQFQDFTIVIDKGVVQNKKLHVFVSKAVTVLPEVVVKPYDLSGNVRVDVEIIPVAKTDLPNKSAAEIDPYEWKFPPDSIVSPRNAAMKEAVIFSGGNFANIFRDIYTSRDEITNLGREEDIDEQILLLYDDDFFKQNLDIEKENIYEFIYFAEDHGLTSAMLKPENEMQLIEFLVAQSQKYKQRKAEN